MYKTVFLFAFLLTPVSIFAGSTTTNVNADHRSDSYGAFLDFVSNESMFEKDERETLQKLLDLAQEFQNDHNADPSKKTADLTISQLNGIICAFIRFFNKSGVPPENNSAAVCSGCPFFLIRIF